MTMERGRVRERDNRLSGEPSKAVFYNPGIPTPTNILNSLSTEQIEAYTSYIRIHEICEILESKDYLKYHMNERDRSPSPAPIYDNNGKRSNTREIRYKRKYENERNYLVERLLELVPSYKAPEWYKPKPSKYIDKLYIKNEEYPEINFIGLLIGPRGNTLKKLQEDSGAKIGIRGQGSVKGGKNIQNISPELNNLEEKLHCLISADTIEKVELAKKLCEEIMNKAIFSPVGQNDLKRNQLRELAKLNGTFRENTEPKCEKCGKFGHIGNECKNIDSFTTKLICEKCGNVGHLTKDCKIDDEKSKEMDEEFENFMNELGEGDSTVEKRVIEEKEESNKRPKYDHMQSQGQQYTGQHPGYQKQSYNGNYQQYPPQYQQQYQQQYSKQYQYSQYGYQDPYYGQQYEYPQSYYPQGHQTQHPQQPYQESYQTKPNPFTKPTSKSTSTSTSTTTKPQLPLVKPPPPISKPPPPPLSSKPPLPSTSKPPPPAVKPPPPPPKTKVTAGVPPKKAPPPPPPPKV